MKTPEGYEKDQVDSYLDTIECWYCKPATFGYGKSGTPDRIGVYKGHFFAVEVKRPGKEPTPLQWRRIREIQNNGGFAAWGTGDMIIKQFNAWRRRLAD